MGMDMYIYRAKNKKIFESDIWMTDYNEDVLKEVYYSRKFWDLYNNVSVFKDYTCGEYKELTKNDVKEMLEFSVYNPDYVGGFGTVVLLCELYYNWDADIEKGYKFFIECDW